MPTPPPTQTFLTALTQALGPGQVSVDPGDLQAYGRDWTRVAEPKPCAVAWPRSTAEVVAIVHVCRQFHVPIVPSGGRTGLAAGAVAAHGELVLSLERMRALGPVDTVGQTVFAQAGVVTQALQDHVAPYGLIWPIDLAAKGSSTVGGNLSTNAGGLKVIRYGHARKWVLGLEVVTAAGEVLQAGGALEKDNTGLDVKGLFLGTEGTLGIVTGATLKLTRRPGRLDVLLLGAAGLAEALGILQAVRKAPVELHAFELFTAFCLDRVVAHTGLPYPLSQRAECYVLAEVANPGAFDLDAWLAELLERGLVQDGTRAQDSAQGRALWAYRERITESLAAQRQSDGTPLGPPHKNDVAAPVAALPDFVADLERDWHARRPEARLALFGHVGDGNLHLNTLRPDGLPIEQFRERCVEADAELFALVARHGGSISAEHGIGLVKKPYLALTHGPALLATMRAVKRALDPDNLLNPGKIFDPD